MKSVEINAKFAVVILAAFAIGEFVAPGPGRVALDREAASAPPGADPRPGRR